VNTCIVCGYDKLDYPQYENGFPTHTICPCCGFQSGFDDDAFNEPVTIEEYRIRWIKNGAVWFSTKPKQPSDYNLRQQLKNIDVKLEDFR
jgi:hypothetical protein